MSAVLVDSNVILDIFTEDADLVQLVSRRAGPLCR